MVEVASSLSSSVTALYNIFLSKLPLWSQKFVNLSLIVLIVVLYSIMFWKVYHWIARRDILRLSVTYENLERPLTSRLLKGFIYILEKLILLPFIIFIWFIVFTFFIILLTENVPIQSILVVSTIIITSIRMTSYYNENLSRDLAKLLPLTLLGVFLTQFGVFNIGDIISNVTSLKNYFSDIWIYFLFIFGVELILTFLDILFKVSGIADEEDKTIEEP